MASWLLLAWANSAATLSPNSAHAHSTEPPISLYFIGLGGNQGDVAACFRDALGDIESNGVRVLRASRCYRTRAVGKHAGEDFLNAVAELETQLEPLGLLDLLQGVETRLGRVRDVHWGPRTLDLDVILNESNIVRHPRLIIPHPHCWYRRFVIDPLVEISPNAIHPLQQATFAELQSRLRWRPFRVAVTGLEDTAAANVSARIRQAFEDIETDAPDNEITVDFGASEPIESQRKIAAGDAQDPLQFLTDVLNSALAEPVPQSVIWDS